MLFFPMCFSPMCFSDMFSDVFWMFLSVALVAYGCNGVVTTDGWELRPDDLFINQYKKGVVLQKAVFFWD